MMMIISIIINISVATLVLLSCYLLILLDWWICSVNVDRYSIEFGSLQADF